MHLSGDPPPPPPPPGNPGPTRDRKMGGGILLGKEEFIKTKSPGSGACQCKFKLKLTLSNAPVTAKPLLYPPPTPKKHTVPFKSKLTLDSRSLRESRIESRIETRFSIFASRFLILDSCATYQTGTVSLFIIN